MPTGWGSHCKGKTHWAEQCFSSQSHSDLLFLSQGGHPLLFQEKHKLFQHSDFSSFWVKCYALMSSSVIDVKYKSPFSSIPLFIESNGWISPTQGGAWQCLIISIFNSGRNSSSEFKRKPSGRALDCRRPACRQERRICKSGGSRWPSQKKGF